MKFEKYFYFKSYKSVTDFFCSTRAAPPIPAPRKVASNRINTTSQNNSNYFSKNRALKHQLKDIHSRIQRDSMTSVTDSPISPITSNKLQNNFENNSNENAMKQQQHTNNNVSRYKVTGNLQHYRQSVPTNTTQIQKYSPERFSTMNLVYTHAKVKNIYQKQKTKHQHSFFSLLLKM